ncbi:MAG: M13 family metallopeptidase [Bacteroidota bacterium]
MNRKNQLTAICLCLLFACALNPAAAQKSAKKPTISGIDPKNFDTDVVPCDNFYRFATGGWMKANPLPSTESRWGTFNKLGKDNDEKIRVILEQRTNSGVNYPKGSPDQLVADFYRSALDEATLNQRGFEPIRSRLKTIDTWTDRGSLMNLLAEMRWEGYAPFFGFYVGSDAKKSDQNIVNLGQGGLSLPDRDYYLKSDSNSLSIQVAFRTYVDRLFSLSGDRAELQAGARIFTLEKQLAEASMTRVDRRDPDKTYNKYAYNDFKRPDQFGFLAWDDFFSAFATPSFDSLIVGQPAYLKSLQALLSTLTDDDLRLYLKWNVLNGSAGLLGAEAEQARFDFYQTTLSGTKQMKPRWERAIDLTNGNMGETVGQLFVREHFSPESRARVEEMVENLRAAFRERIQKLGWMSVATQQQALKKLEAFRYKIGYPDQWKDYSMLDIRSDRLYENVLQVRRRGMEIMLARIGKPVDRNEWGMTPQTVNAYYSPSLNEIVFPAGILQPPFFNAQAEDAVNYGGIGAVIGHEFSHGFDDKGSKFDGKGNLSNWWLDDDRRRFDSITAMITQQFEAFQPLPDQRIDGKLTLGENIADLAGLTMAYYAYNKAYGGQPTFFDGMSWQQRFFVGWAQVWAQNISEKELRKRLITDSHSPGEYRVLGPLSNLKEFQEAWGCPGTNLRMDIPASGRITLW